MGASHTIDGSKEANPLEMTESNSPLRILTVANVPPDPNSGAAGTVYYTNQALRDLGHSVDEIWAEDLGPRRIAHGNMHSLVEQPVAYRRRTLLAIRQSKYDVVQISQPQGWLAARAIARSGFGGMTVNRSHGVELRANDVLPAFHRKLGVPVSRFPLATHVIQRLLDQQWRSSARWFDTITVGCQQDRQCLLERLGVHAHVVPHGVHQRYLDQPLPNRLPNQQLRILHVGQYAFFKGSNVLIAILNRLLRDARHVQFTWVCNQSHHAVIREQLATEVHSQVVLKHWQDQDSLVDVYDDHDIFLFPSLFEGFGKAPFEAMARGLCVVASDESGMRDHIENNRSGILCAVGETEEFLAAIQRIRVNRELARQIGEQATKVARKLSWRNCGQQYASLYRNLLDGASTRRRQRAEAPEKHVLV